MVRGTLGLNGDYQRTTTIEIRVASWRRRAWNVRLRPARYDDPAYGRSGRTMFRDREIVRLRMQGSRVSEIAKSVCTSERTVYRVIQRDRDKIVGVAQPAASDSRVLEVANAF